MMPSFYYYGGIQEQAFFYCCYLSYVVDKDLFHKVELSNYDLRERRT
jgi:hypothetical protein